ncbi:MAG: deaminase [Acidobacteria bacterium]|nr:deaminase [Acidobacteriota bacterium]
MIIRLLDFALLTFLVWLVWSQVIRDWRGASAAPADHAGGSGGQGGQRGQPPPPRKARGPAAQEPMTLVRCGVCGVHVPSGRALPGPAGGFVCSEACRAQTAAAGR